MLNDIKPFLPLYTGSYVRVTTKDARFDAVMSGVFFDRWHSSSKRHELTVQVAFGDDIYHFYKLDQVQLLLRPLSDMTEEECDEVGLDYAQLTHPSMEVRMFYTWQFRHLLSKGFDLFGLIEAGLAIDKTKEVRHA